MIKITVEHLDLKKDIYVNDDYLEFLSVGELIFWGSHIIEALREIKVKAQST